MAVVDLAEEAFYERAVADATLVAELGHTAGDERIIWGFDKAFLGDERDDDLPVLMYHVPTEDELWEEIGSVRLQVDLVVPQSSSAAGGIEKMQSVDDAFTALFRDARWTHDGTRYSSVLLPARRRPPEGHQPLRRIRELDISVG